MAPETPQWTNGFLNAMEKAINRGLHIINVTQCSGGSVVMGQYETSKRLEAMQMINGKDITTEAAITKAMYLLGRPDTKGRFKEFFETSLRGEMHQN